jgi:pimeloyl-ACP methyl ester carboxylesterase
MSAAVRRVFVSRYGTHCLVGTLHAAAHYGAAWRPRVGLLLLNAGPAPRAGNSDLSVRSCEHAATNGVPGVRFDLPGLGDSTGNSWAHAYQFWAASQAGEFDGVIAHLVEDFRRRLGLSSVLLGGLCAAGVASLRAADRVGDSIAASCSSSRSSVAARPARTGAPLPDSRTTARARRRQGPARRVTSPPGSRLSCARRRDCAARPSSSRT